MQALSQRLVSIASFVPDGASVADIGTDHGYLAIELIKSGKAKKVIATDIGEKPLKNAEKNILKANAQGIELRLCDGLSGISPLETDTIIIAGMGGEVISGILERGKIIAENKNATIILQPTTSPEALRRFLCMNGYEIAEEMPIYENGKLYSAMLVRFTGKSSKPDESFYYIGLVTPKTRAGLLYIEKQKSRCFKCLSALKNIPNKNEEFSSYQAAFKGIEETLKSFKEKTNGI